MPEGPAPWDLLATLRRQPQGGLWGGLSEEDREHIYSRRDSRHYPRLKGEGLRVASAEIAETASPRALGIAEAPVDNVGE